MEQVFMASETSSACISERELNLLYDDIIGELIDDVMFGTCLEIHREFKLYILCLQDEKEREKYEIVDEEDCDVFGRPMVKGSYTCTCTLCNRCINADRFTRHLEDHIGKSRTSLRIANQRIKNAVNDESDIDGFDDVLCEGSQRSAKKRMDRRTSNSSRMRGKPKAVRFTDRTFKMKGKP